MTKSPNLVSTLHWIYDVALVRRLDANEADAVMAAAHERNIFSMRPAKRHCRASRTTASHSRIRQIVTVPYLFGEHPTLVRKIFDRRDEWFWIASGSQFVVAAFSGHNGPATANARSVESAAIILLPIAIMIVATPARALRQVMFEYAINHFDRVAHERIVRIANTEPHQMKEITTDDISRGVQTAAVGDLNHRHIRVSVGIRCIWIGRSDADVMTTYSFHQLALRCDSPIFHVGRQPVGIRKNKIRDVRSAEFFGPFCGAREGGNQRGNRGRRVAGVFSPAVLSRDRSLHNQVRSGAHNHHPRMEQTKRVLFMQMPRQQYRETNLVELPPRPIGPSIYPTVLWETSVRRLHGRQPDQRAQRGACLTGGEQRGRAVHEVARPHQMIAAQILIAFGFAPGNAH